MAFDQIGSIAILEVRGNEDPKLIAGQIMQNNRNIKTVALKASELRGKYRVRKLKIIAGEKTTLATYKESGCVFELDVAKVYFSPRLSFERQRIAEQVKNGEKILVLFAGVGPYAIVIAKKLKLEGKNTGEKTAGKKTTEIIAIELNPAAVKFMKRNIELNKVGNMVTAVKGDVTKVLRAYRNWADRIIMPLPHTAEKYLPQAIRSTAKSGIVHFYTFSENRGKNKKKINPFKAAVAKVQTAAKKAKRKVKIISKRIVNTYATGVVQVVVDVKVL